MIEKKNKTRNFLKIFQGKNKEKISINHISEKT